MSASRTLAALAVACGVVLAACGDGDDEPVAAGGAPVDAELEVTAGVAGDPASRGTARLSCGPGGASGTAWLAGAAAGDACALLADDAALARLGPPPADQVCAEVFGGPDVATVTGTVDGEAVDAALDRRNACATTRWDALAPLLPDPVGA